jgi:hypothetical protein
LCAEEARFLNKTGKSSSNRFSRLALTPRDWAASKGGGSQDWLPHFVASVRYGFSDAT